MKKYRVTVFHDRTSENRYFDDRDDAISFGKSQNKKLNVTAAFLLICLANGKYDVEMQIK